MKHEHVVRCDMLDCGDPAVYKIAAPWSDGSFWELKTYGFSCADHLAPILREAQGRWLEYEPVRAERVEEIGIFRFEPGKGDRRLQRDREVESTLLP